jgi:hypothetical protein
MVVSDNTCKSHLENMGYNSVQPLNYYIHNYLQGNNPQLLPYLLNANILALHPGMVEEINPGILDP